MNDDAGQPVTEFLITKEYRRFAEFCDTCRRDRYIGVCHGAPGVGKTLSARHYACWDLVGRVIELYHTLQPYPAPDLAECRTLFYTPGVALSPKRLALEVGTLHSGFNTAVERALSELHDPRAPVLYSPTEWVELVIVDEADRLNFLSLEELRDRYDRGGFGLVLIGMPGLEKRLVRYPQLYSRIGFVHQYRALSVEELQFILAHKWAQLGLSLSADDFTDAEAMAAIARITGGNFRLVQRLFTQVERILHINELHCVTKEVVEAARETLLIGAA
jgi:DNA transposition AAA+ family ATPase